MYGPIFIGAVREVFPQGGNPVIDVWDTTPPKDWVVSADPARARGFVLFQDVGGVPTYFTEGNMAEQSNARLQITLWASTPQLRYTWSRALMKHLAKHPQFEPLDSPQSLHDTNTELYGSRFDVSCWYDAD
ncbi:hypothetical protein [Stenotrophomonas phage BUCT603B1]|nr:hypothetical protein [Stenotrophomonas phage BUCT603B1]HDS1002018.1 hypothetical protein [Stenotrophomonas maltophilia]